ncbi:sensor histidine kinase, partial [Pseudomonas sp. GTC 16481]
DRMGRITASLRSFARRSDDSGQASLAKAIEATLQVLGNRISACQLQLHNHYEDQQLAIDQTRLEQILVNLIGNALDAMAAQPQPELWLEGEVQGDKYRLQVRDNGHGIDAEARKHLFEPFFTTKPGEHGLGLGLTLSASLAAAAKGSLNVEHPVTGGSAFVLALPLVSPPNESAEHP